MHPRKPGWIGAAVMSSAPLVLLGSLLYMMAKGWNK
jgi:hypothetical protein